MLFFNVLSLVMQSVLIAQYHWSSSLRSILSMVSRLLLKWFSTAQIHTLSPIRKISPRIKDLKSYLDQANVYRRLLSLRQLSDYENRRLSAYVRVIARPMYRTIKILFTQLNCFLYVFKPRSETDDSCNPNMFRRSMGYSYKYQTEFSKGPRVWECSNFLLINSKSI